MRHTICYELTNTFENVQSHYGRKVQRKTLINLIDIGLLISSLISIQHGNVILFEYFYLSFAYIRFSLIDQHSIECTKATKVKIRSFLDGWIRLSENKSASPLTLWTELGRRRSILIKNNSILPINFIEADVISFNKFRVRLRVLLLHAVVYIEANISPKSKWIHPSKTTVRFIRKSISYWSDDFNSSVIRINYNGIDGIIVNIAPKQYRTAASD